MECYDILKSRNERDDDIGTTTLFDSDDDSGDSDYDDDSRIYDSDDDDDFK